MVTGEPRRQDVLRGMQSSSLGGDAGIILVLFSFFSLGGHRKMKAICATGRECLLVEASSSLHYGETTRAQGSSSAKIRDCDTTSPSL